MHVMSCHVMSCWIYGTKLKRFWWINFSLVLNETLTMHPSIIDAILPQPLLCNSVSQKSIIWGENVSEWLVFGKWNKRRNTLVCGILILVSNQMRTVLAHWVFYYMWTILHIIHFTWQRCKQKDRSRHIKIIQDVTFYNIGRIRSLDCDHCCKTFMLGMFTDLW